MEYVLDYEYEQQEEYTRKNLILLGTNIRTGKPVYMKHNPKSERMIISGATGRGKTNVAKLIVSQKIQNFSEKFNKNFLILDTRASIGGQSGFHRQIPPSFTLS